MTELDDLYQAFHQIGEDPAVILGPHTAHLVAHGHRVLSQQSVPGLLIQAEPEEGRIRARVVVAEGCAIAQPVHLCFGLFERYGTQQIDLELAMGEGSQASFWSHCLFTVPAIARHSMDARIELAPGARVLYSEGHYHGTSGGMEVLPKARATVGEGAHFRTDFSLTRGRIGLLDIDLAVEVAADASAELTSKVFGHGNDEIRIAERVYLNGNNARGLVKSRVAVEGQSRARILGATYGNAPGARGHVDCLEIVRDSAVAVAVPEVQVSHPEAKVTHEAAIGSVDQRQLEALMARGLDPEGAVERIILGLLQ